MDSTHPTSPTEDTLKTRYGRSCLANLVMLVLGLIATLAIMEIGVRIVLGRSDQLLKASDTVFKELHVSDDTLLYRQRPDAHVVYTQAEFSVDVRTNAHGLRDVDHTYDKPDSVFRVFVLGDSFMAALQVDRADALPDQLEARLNADPRTAESGYRFEVLNGDVSGYNTLDEYLMLREEALRYSPDLELYAYVVNDTVGLISPELRLWRDTLCPGR